MQKVNEKTELYRAVEILNREYKEKRMGMPEKYGLLEANVIAVDLRNRNAKAIFTMWWEELKKSGSGRDQLSLPFVLWREGFLMGDVGCLGTDVYGNDKFRVVKHDFL